MIVLKKPKIGEQINLLTDIQIKFIKSDRSKINVADFDYLDLKKSVEEDSSFPKEIIFEWEAQEDGILQISESENFDNFFQEIGKSSVKITNLKSGTRYYWRVVCVNEISDIFYFDTANTCPRFIKIDGLTNVRDCGGWKTISGKYIKQGQLYRGSEMNSHLSISDDGLKTMKNVLKIKSILDLRGQNEEVKDVYQGLYKNIPAYPYGTWFNHPEIAREIFEFVLNTENFPLYFHCWGGADRTGTLSFLLGAILGQSYKDLFDDYEITSLSIWGARSRNSEGHFKPLLNMFNEFNGETTQEKAENYLISCGVSKTLIKNFQEFMLD